jgi:hypothetical protein
VLTFFPSPPSCPPHTCHALVVVMLVCISLPNVAGYSLLWLALSWLVVAHRATLPPIVFFGQGWEDESSPFPLVLRLPPPRRVLLESGTTSTWVLITWSLHGRSAVVVTVLSPLPTTDRLSSRYKCSWVWGWFW